MKSTHYEAPITEDELVEYLLALHEAGASEEEMRTYLRTTKTSKWGEPYLALFRSFQEEHERLTLAVTELPMVRSSKVGEKWTHFSPKEILTSFMRMLSWKYAASGMAVMGVVALSTWTLLHKEGASLATKNTELSGEERSVATTEPLLVQENAVVQKNTPTGEAQSVTQTDTEIKDSTSQEDIDAVALAVSGNEGTESFADEDGALDMSADEALLDNDQMYDETIF